MANNTLVKNNICIGGESKQNALFSIKKNSTENAHMHSMPRIGPDL